jgi:lysophospholipase L1-like esterase
MIARLGLLVVASALSLAAAELVLRVAFPPSFLLDPRSDAYWRARFDEARPLAREHGTNFDLVESDVGLGWRNRRGVRLPDRSTNAHGLRGQREIAYARTPGVRRVVVLGDSMTFGFGVGDDDPFPARLEARLERCEVLNLGVNGYGTDQQLLHWLAEGRRYAPDVAVLVFYVDDFHRNANLFRELPKPRFELEEDRLVLRGVPVPSEREMLRTGADGNVSGVRVLRAASFALRRFVDDEPAEAFAAKAALMERILAEFARTARAAGARALLVTLPSRDGDEPGEARILAAVEGAAERVGLPVLALDPVLRGAERAGGAPVFLPHDGHFSPRGHDVVAERLAEHLREWLPESGAAAPARSATGGRAS